jgi:hypothetical protein
LGAYFISQEIPEIEQQIKSPEPHKGINCSHYIIEGNWIIKYLISSHNLKYTEKKSPLKYTNWLKKYRVLLY